MLNELFNLGDKHTQHMGVLFGYLFGRIGKYEFREALGDKALAKAVWQVADTSGYVQRECKLYAYAVHQNRLVGLPTSPAKFGIHKDDVSVLRKLNLNHIPTQYKAYSLFDFKTMETAILCSRELQVWMGKFISRKLIFLTRSYGLKRSDIEATLLHSGMFALRKQYPIYETELHALNICKTAMHNAGMGLIEFWTRDKRNALLKENGTFQAVHVPYEALSHLSVEPEHNDELRVNLQCLVGLAPRLKPRARQFIQAAAGLHDEGFSIYIGTDNADAAYQWEYNRYMQSLRDYLGISTRQTQLLLSNLRKALL